MMKRLLLIWIIFSAVVSAREQVNIITIDGIINPASSEFISKMIERAETDNANCLIIKLDTPGGLVNAMRDITQDILTAKIPVVVYVSPSGARAGSAGVFITLAAHVAAMAPGTNIGAASVVSIGMASDSANATMLKKATNDAVAFIKSIAQERGRNEEWAEKAVTEAASVTAFEALELNVIDHICPNLDSLLAVLDGKEIETSGGKQVFKTLGANKQFISMPFRYKVLDIISDPSIAYILFIIGLAGLFFELNSPGTILPGVVGGISLILAFYAMNTLPVNYAGILLILLAIVLFILEIKIPSFGILTIGGVISFVLGSIMLYETGAPFIKVSWEIIIAVTIFVTVFFVFALGMVLRAQRGKRAIGLEAMVEGYGEAMDNFKNGRGRISYEGEIWDAYSSDGIKKGETVKILGVKGLKMEVKKMEDGKEG